MSVEWSLLPSGAKDAMSFIDWLSVITKSNVWGVSEPRARVGKFYDMLSLVVK